MKIITNCLNGNHSRYCQKGAAVIQFFTLLVLLLIGTGSCSVRADDNIFPPSPQAAPFINFDGRGFIVNGKRTFILSAGIEYARVPRELWRDRLLKIKRAGFNCIEMYTFWNFHEPRPGEFNFTGDHDLDAFLKLAKSLGLYAIVRVGPYYCAEWEGGGYPNWLRFVPGLRVREANPQFLAAVDQFWGKLIPIIAANQINHGGSVILAQLENEHLQGGGTDLPNAYFVHLRDTAVSLGLEVPYFFSGLHHGGDPAGDHPWSSATRKSPWMTTEFWSVNFDRYNQTAADVVTYDRRMWKVLAYGGNGLNFYMFHGGTNFGYTNNDEDAASYDYGSAIGQTGDLRPTYYRFKRAALFAGSFESILGDSDNSTDTYQGVATSSNVRITARTAPTGTILFLDNPGNDPVQTQVREADGTLFPASGPITLAPSQIAPVVENYALLPSVTVVHSTPLLGVLRQNDMTTLVAESPVGDSVEMSFRLTQPASDASNVASNIGNQITLSFPITSDSTQVSTFRVGTQIIRVLAMSTQESDRTWFINNDIVVGPKYVGDIGTIAGKIHLTSESAPSDVAPSVATVYDAVGTAPHEVYSAVTNSTMPDAPSLSAWQALPGDAQAEPNYTDALWKTSKDPMAMGADGDNSAYAWYRSSVNVPQGGLYSLNFTDGANWASVFVNGQHAGSAKVDKGVSVTLPAGQNKLAVFVSQSGRAKLFGYMGPFDAIDAKGLRGPVVLDRQTAGTSITTWRLQGNADNNHATVPSDTSGAGWADGSTGPDVFNGRKGYAWYVTTLPSAIGAHHRVRFENVDDRGTVYLNGQQVATHVGWGTAFVAPLDAAWNDNGPNVLSVLVQNYDGGGGIQGAVTLIALGTGDEIPIVDWKMHGGIADPNVLTGWKSVDSVNNDGSPIFYRATFNTTPPGETGPHPILRVTTTGLSRGFVWLNGHNLGRYPERVPIDGLYLPECWLKSGANELVIFDEEGNRPNDSKLWIEQVASRIVVPMAEK